jgi:hypothetical protein
LGGPSVWPFNSPSQAAPGSFRNRSGEKFRIELASWKKTRKFTPWMEHEPEPHEPMQPAPAQPQPAGEPDFTRPVRLIAELLENPDFPKSALGELVDIGGYIGVVTDLVGLSLKVRSPDGLTKSFNANGLRRIYGRVIPPDPIPMTAEQPKPPAPAPRPRLPRTQAPPPPPPPPEPTVEPDFSKPVKKISEYVKRPDYPQCTLGEHVEIADYSGVVVQIHNRSLKVRSQAEITRSYNADALRRL